MYIFLCSYYFSECGNAPLHPRPAEVRIVGGRNAQFGVWPWQVNLLLFKLQ